MTGCGRQEPYLYGRQIEGKAAIRHQMMAVADLTEIPPHPVTHEFDEKGLGTIQRTSDDKWPDLIDSSPT
jgi:hypothetical protein